MRLQDFVDELADLDHAEKLEMIVELADELPELPERYQVTPHPHSCRVQECQSAVYLWVERDAQGKVQVWADVAKNSPTVRGLVTLVIQAVSGLSPAEVLELPEDLLPVLGLTEALGMQRRQGLRGVMTRIHRELRQQTVSPA